MSVQLWPGARAYAERSGDQVADRRCGCRDCGGSLGGPQRHPDGWSHCWRCRCAYRLREEIPGHRVVGFRPNPAHCRTVAGELATWASAHAALVASITWRRWKVYGLS